MINIRKGTRQDVGAAFALVEELAIYEKAPEEVITSEEIYAEDAFGEKSWFEFFIAEDEKQEVMGVAIFYLGYSTWKGRMLYLDDLVVAEAHRRKGIGKLLLDKLVEYGKAQGIKQMRWQVLDWNTPAINLYKKIEAQIETEWWTCKLSKERLEAWR